MSMRVTAAALALLGTTAGLVLGQTPQVLPSSGNAAGFEQALTARPFEFPRDFSSAICGPIVHHDDLCALPRLGDSRVKRIGYCLFSIICSDQN